MTYFNGNDIDGDCCIMEAFLMDLTFYNGRQMGGKKIYTNPKIGGSILFGTTWRGFIKNDKLTHEKIMKKIDPETGLYETKVMTDFPELRLVFDEFASLYFNDFEFTHIQINKNFKCLPHRDKANIGESVLISLGDFTGGKTGVDFTDGRQILDSHNQPVKFNGSRYTHWVEDFEGTRFSLVFFNSKKLSNQ
tara:strand:+ start:1055 stop:1630 length:576 start_codon:yes stop_codon:yes gene_type:complete